jgi:protein subunit release factor B
MSKKELLFSVTRDDCRWDYFRGSGKGGQKRNKTCSAVRCTHTASGAVGQSDETRSQHDNKRLAFVKMARSNKFQTWARIEAARVTGKLAQIEEWVDREMMMNVKVERKENDKWVDWSGSEAAI